MKKLSVISVLAAIVAISFTGCDPNDFSGPSTREVEVLSKITDGDEVTEYEYDETGLRIGETFSRAGKTIHEMDNYVYENNFNTVTADRLVYNEDGTTTEQTVEINYITVSGYYQFETEYQVFEGNDLVERRVTKYDSGYNISEFTQTMNGVVLVHRHSYDFMPMETATTPYFTYKESKNGGEDVQMSQLCTEIYTNPNTNSKTIVEYELYAGWKNFTEKGIVVEKMSDYESSNLKVSYTMTHYDADGTNPVEKDVEKEWDLITYNI